MKDRLKIEVGKRLKQLREEFRLTQQEFAVQMLVSRSAVSHNEAGMFFPKVRMLHILAEDKGVSLDWLLSGRGTMFARPWELGDDLSGFLKSNGDLMDMLLLMQTEKRLLYDVLNTYENYKEETKK
ncbi:MAG: helix-turn-helix transcriptional regulator [bacterium]|nr:helix-turn-helix transcriptional regulator [bacterium]